MEEVTNKDLVESSICIPCLLCGESIPVYDHNTTPKVCNDCKSLWKSLKSIRCEEKAKNIVTDIQNL